jgi:hypothetical protein
MAIPATIPAQKNNEAPSTAEGMLRCNLGMCSGTFSPFCALVRLIGFHLWRDLASAMRLAVGSGATTRKTTVWRSVAWSVLLSVVAGMAPPVNLIDLVPQLAIQS